MKTIGIDFDCTYTLDPVLWAGFIAMAEARGWRVICVTGRSRAQPIPEIGIEVIYTDGALKRPFAERAGYRVDIWIDDEPGTVEPCRKLDWSDWI